MQATLTPVNNETTSVSVHRIKTQYGVVDRDGSVIRIADGEEIELLRHGGGSLARRAVVTFLVAFGHDLHEMLFESDWVQVPSTDSAVTA